MNRGRRSRNSESLDPEDPPGPSAHDVPDVSMDGGGKDEPDTIVRTIVNLAKDMGMLPIAEGIETPEQMKELQSLDCEYGQGYYFSKPVPSDAVEKLMLVGNVISGEGGLKWRSKAASA